MIYLPDVNTAILFASYGNKASYYDDWADAFRSAKRFASTFFNIAQTEEQKSFLIQIKDFDLIILLHSISADNLIYASDIKLGLQSRTGTLFSFVGNEVNLPGSPMKSKIDFLTEIKADFVATQLQLKTGRYLYKATGAKIVSIPHALNPTAFAPHTENSLRPIDIGLRSFRYPSIFLGDNDRNRLIDFFSSHKFKTKIITDISSNSRLDRNGWANFLNNCKGTIANEAGGHWIEKDDSTLNAIKSWLETEGHTGIVIKPNSTLRRIFHKLPWFIKEHLLRSLSNKFVSHESTVGKNVDFEEVYEKFFSKKKWPPQHSGKCVSSRHFDAVGTKTCQIMFEGCFNNIFLPNKHYIPLKIDFSNIDEVMRKFSDRTLTEEIVENTYSYILEHHTYSHRIKQIEEIIFSIK